MYAINGVSRSAPFGRYIDCYMVIKLVGRRKTTVNPTSEEAVAICFKLRHVNLEWDRENCVKVRGSLRRSPIEQKQSNLLQPWFRCRFVVEILATTLLAMASSSLSAILRFVSYIAWSKNEHICKYLIFVVPWIIVITEE